MCAARTSPSRAPEINPARRAFLSGTLSHPDPRRLRFPTERIALLKEIVLRGKRRLPDGAIPKLCASNACVGHGVCTLVCPSGALRRFEEPGFQGLEFDSVACIACGACIVVCPEQALQLEPRPADLPQPLPERITRHALSVCSRCDAEFTASPGNELCPACRKNVGLFTHGFSARSNES